MPITDPLNQDRPTNFHLSQQKINILNCPSTSNPDRRDGAPEAWTETFAVTDYSAVLGVSPRCIAALPTTSTGVRPGQGILSQTNRGGSADVKDGLSTTILFAECAGRPNIYRTGREVGGGIATERINGGAWARPGSDFYIDGSKIEDPTTNLQHFQKQQLVPVLRITYLA